jgi:hypothetical protein
MFKPTTATNFRLSHDPEHARQRVLNNNNNNNIYTLRDIIIINDTEPRVSARAAMNARRDEIISAYEDALECPLRNTVANRMVDFIAANHTIEQLLECIERTGLAVRPSPAYLCKVMQNYDSYTYIAFDRVQQREAPMNPALQYPQRDYSHDDFAGDDILAEVERIRNNA